MASEPLSMNDVDSETDLDGAGEGLSQNGQMIGIAVYGGLVLVGFFFGIVTGYDSPKPPIVIVKKEKETPKPPETPKPTPKVTPEPPEPKKIDTPTPPEPKKIDPPMPPEPKKVDPPTPPEPKKEIVPQLVFKDVVPILKKHCTECHGAGKVQGKVDLTSMAKMMDSKGANLLTPGKPDKSDLYTSITQREMPKDRPKPTDKEVMTIRNWILGGAMP
jgi:hypothetical protein